jgi:hypothetical protein
MPVTFRDALSRARISQTDLVRLVITLSGMNVSTTTTSRWARLHARPSAWAIALLVVLSWLTPEQIRKNMEAMDAQKD